MYIILLQLSPNTIAIISQEHFIFVERQRSEEQDNHINGRTSILMEELYNRKNRGNL